MKILSLLFSFLLCWSFAPAAQSVKYEVLHEADDVIWGFDFLSESEIIFTLRGGELKKLNWKTGKVSPVSGAPEVRSRGQGGLLDVRVHPQNPRQIFLTYAKPVGRSEATTALATAVLSESDQTSLQLKELKDIFVAGAPSDESFHFGSRVEFSGEYLFMSIGDRGEREKAQSLAHHQGKIIRLFLNGRVPQDNPFVGKSGALPEIWSYGHRNPQGLAVRKKDGELWSAEFGPRGGDEINRIGRGLNYGWPEVTQGREYYGPKIGVKSKAGMEAPAHYWVPSISPSAITFYEGPLFQNWKDHLFVATLSGSHLRRIELSGNKVIKEEELFKDKGERYRAVRTAPDGALFLATDSGQLIRLSKP